LQHLQSHKDIFKFLVTTFSFLVSFFLGVHFLGVLKQSLIIIPLWNHFEWILTTLLLCLTTFFLLCPTPFLTVPYHFSGKTQKVRGHSKKKRRSAPNFFCAPPLFIPCRCPWLGLPTLATFKLHSVTQCDSDACLITCSLRLAWLCKMESPSNQKLVATYNLADGRD